MFKTKRWLALAAVLSLAVAALAGCAAPAERLAVKLKAKVAVENCAVETDDAERVRLTVTNPPLRTRCTRACWTPLRTRRPARRRRSRST